MIVSELEEEMIVDAGFTSSGCALHKVCESGWIKTNKIFDIEILEKMKKKNPLVFLDVSVGGDPFEKLVFELFPDVAPKAVESYRAFCTGEKGIGTKTGKPLKFKGEFFHSIYRCSTAEKYGLSGCTMTIRISKGEDLRERDDEYPKLKQDFTVTVNGDHCLKRNSEVFGRLVRGRKVLKKMNPDKEKGKPTVTVKIVHCGEFEDKKMGKDEVDANDVEAQKKKASRDRKRRRYDSSDTYTDSDSTMSSSSDLSSSSDDRRKRRKRSSKKDKYKHGKRRRYKRHVKKRKRRDRKPKLKSKRTSDTESSTETDSEKDQPNNHGRANKRQKVPGKNDPSQDPDTMQTPLQLRGQHPAIYQSVYTITRLEGRVSNSTY